MADDDDPDTIESTWVEAPGAGPTTTSKPLPQVTIDSLAESGQHERLLKEMFGIERETSPGAPQQSREGLLQDYELLERIGRGGFGVVHKARQRTTNQLVAIKFIRIPRDTSAGKREVMAARFQREMALCARLHHPNIVRVMDSGQTGVEEFFSVFSYVPGKNLRQVLDEEGALEPREAQYLMMQVLDALTCAHALGIVHRDLKPANIMLMTTGARRNALVLDYGIGTITKSMRPKTFMQLTGASDFVGTPGYGAPEQWRGEEVTPATDLFSWGLVFIECLTGRRCFTGKSTNEILLRQLSPTPVALPASIVDHPLGHLLAAVTNKNQSRRPTQASELLAVLDAIDLQVTREMMNRSGPLQSRVHERELFPDGLGPEVELDETPLSPAGAVRRRQAVLLCCVVELGARPDAEGVHDSAAESLEQWQLLDTCRRIVHENGGALITACGDRAIYLFGYPSASPEDARSGAHAAMDIHDELSRQTTSLRQQGFDSSIRIGLHYGEILAPAPSSYHPEYLAVGTTQRLAVRIAAEAPLGAVMISADARALLHEDFELESAGELVHGLGRQQLYRLRGERG